jgi:hypothetical protein
VCSTQFCRLSKNSRTPQTPTRQSSKTLGPSNRHFLNSSNKGIIPVTQPPTFRHNKIDLPAPSDLPPDVITTIIYPFKHLSMVAMHDMLGKMPYEWQLQIISHLSILKKLGSTSICPGVILLLRPTGGGKSSVCGVYSIICTGVSLAVTPLLSLGADQTQKTRQNASLNGGPVPIGITWTSCGVHKHSTCFPNAFFSYRLAPTLSSSSSRLRK